MFWVTNVKYFRWGLPTPLAGMRIRILPVTTYLYYYFHLEQKINQNKQTDFFSAEPDPDPGKKCWILNTYH